jgi:hypothetical protein
MTVREWFRLVRREHTPATMEEQHALMAVAGGLWLEAEFWTLFRVGQIVAVNEAQHCWWLDEPCYVWRCRHCTATVTSDTIGELEPRLEMFDGCLCVACKPCTRSKMT